MPVIKSAKKKLRQDKKRQEANKIVKDLVKSEVKAFRKSPSETKLKAVFHAVDKAVKKNVVHKNKAARMKGTLSALINKKEHATPHVEKKVKAKVVKKAPAKAKK